MRASREANRALMCVSAAVLLASSTWLSGSAVTPVLIRLWSLGESGAAWLTISVQLGFIAGTFLYAILNLSDIFNARRVFFVSALLGALFNAAFAWLGGGFETALLFRFLTGLTLAGIYPVGMKIVATWFESGLGWRLGILVGALTAGTSMPYLLGFLGPQVDWRTLVSLASLLALGGGVLVLAGLSDGPYLRESSPFRPHMMVRVFADRPFRLAAFGYFGHMWELYAVWSLLSFYLAAAGIVAYWIPLLAFLFIASGTLGCVGGGWISRRAGERRVALVALLASALFCLLSPLLIQLSPLWLAPLVLLWGVVVVADSPQFSALAARYCPARYTGTALTVQNGVGFAVTVLSIQLVPWAALRLGWGGALTILAPGPLLGAWAMLRLGRTSSG